MAATTDPDEVSHATIEGLVELLRREYRDDLSTVYQHYPERRSLEVDFRDLLTHDPAVADDLLESPQLVIEVLEDAARRVDIPVEMSVDELHVRPVNLPDEHTHYPGEFSPTEHAYALRAIQGEVVKATDTFVMHERTTFECKRCGTDTVVPQLNDEFQEPHECQGCERQGPFDIVQQRSESVDGQKLRVRTPADRAQGDGSELDVFVRDDLAGVATVGDQVTIPGIIQLEQSNDANKFEPWLDARAIEIEETDAEDLDITPEQRERIRELAARDDALEVAANSLAPKIHGYDVEKRAIILSLVGGSHVEYGGQDSDRGQIHILLIGDPSTAKSKLVNRATDVGWRAVPASGTGSTQAGITASAVQDDFGDGSWSLEAGAAVKANRGVLTIDELDDMPAEYRSALLEPMSNQQISINKAGINTTLSTRVAVIAAANPAQGRFDRFAPIPQQFDFGETLLSRFDLVFTFQDVPDRESDETVAGHILDARDAAKADDSDSDVTDPPVAPDTLRAWIALAKQQPAPTFASEEVTDHIRETFVELRGMHGDGEDDPVPVTFRNLEAVVRIAEAAARFELSETIDRRHATIATDLVGESMQQVGKDPETGQLDADVLETGQSKTQRERVDTLADVMVELQTELEGAGVPRETILDAAEREGIDPEKASRELDNLIDKSAVYRPPEGGLRYVGDR